MWGSFAGELMLSPLVLVSPHLDWNYTCCLLPEMLSLSRAQSLLEGIFPTRAPAALSYRSQLLWATDAPRWVSNSTAHTSFPGNWELGETPRAPRTEDF